MEYTLNYILPLIVAISLFSSLSFAESCEALYKKLKISVNTEGKKFENDAELVYSNFEINSKYPTEVELQADQLLKRGLLAKDFQNRKDDRALEFVTIDGKETIDRDDAIHVSRNNKGNYVLEVAVPDIAHYISLDSAIGRWYMEQSTSFYLKENIVHLLPPKLISGLLSIDPQVDRLAYVYKIEVNAKTGEKMNFSVRRSVVNSRKAYTYNEFQDKIDNPSFRSPQEDMIIQLYDLLKKNRKPVMQFPFSTEKVATFNENGNISFESPKLNQSNELIEIFMVSVNNMGANFMRDNKIPGIYRGQEESTDRKVSTFYDLIKKVGYQIPYRNKLTVFENLQESFSRMKGHERPEVIIPLLFYVTELAKNSTEPHRHFYLNVGSYAFHTSPLRRVSDFWNQIMYSYYLEGKINSKEVDHLVENIDNVVARDNENMLKASRAEAQWKDIKTLKNHGTSILGKDYYGIIIRENMDHTAVYLPELDVYAKIRKREASKVKKPFANLNKKVEVKVQSVDYSEGQLFVVPLSDIRKEERDERKRAQKEEYDKNKQERLKNNQN